jgi:hypothetical protein
MKKTAYIVIAFLFALLLWNVFAFGGDSVVSIDGDEFDGPLGALLAMLFAGGGIILIGGLGIGAVVLALAISPLLLPLLLPLALIWYMVGRSRKNRMMREHAV